MRWIFDNLYNNYWNVQYKDYLLVSDLSKKKTQMVLTSFDNVNKINLSLCKWTALND